MSPPISPRCWSRAGGLRPAALGLAAAAVGAALLVAIGASGAFYGFFDVSDVGLYHRYALAQDAGARPYLDFAAEYPPLALRLLAAPGHPAGADAYARWFAAFMLVALGLAGGLVAAAAARARPRAAAWAAGAFGLSLPLLGAICANRFDALVALALAAFAWAVAARRFGLAGVALGLGAAVKLSPAVLLPLLLVMAATRGGRARALLGFAAAAVGPFLAAGEAGLAAVGALVRFHGARPLQAESVLAAPALVGHLLGLGTVRMGSAYGSQFVDAPGAAFLARASGPLALLLLAGVYALAFRARARVREVPAAFAAASVAVLLALLVPSKVLSPQYLVWLLPGAALLAAGDPAPAGKAGAPTPTGTAGGRGLAALLGAAFLLTHLEFPARYWRFVALAPGPVALVVGRDLVLIAALAWAVALLARAPVTAPPGPAADSDP